FRLHSRYLSPQLPRVLETLGFDRFYERGEGCYLYDAEGRRYLDFLSGFGVYALGRGHPTVVGALHQAIDADLPNLVQLDCALLPGSGPVPFGDLDALAAQLRRGDVAALVIEPIQGKGVNVAPDDFWPAAEELCRRHGTLLVIDEIQTGLGRTGRFFCHEHW